MNSSLGAAATVAFRGRGGSLVRFVASLFLSLSPRILRRGRQPRDSRLRALPLGAAAVAVGGSLESPLLSALFPSEKESVRRRLCDVRSWSCSPKSSRPSSPTERRAAPSSRRRFVLQLGSFSRKTHCATGRPGQLLRRRVARPSAPTSGCWREFCAKPSNAQPQQQRFLPRRFERRSLVQTNLPPLAALSATSSRVGLPHSAFFFALPPRQAAAAAAPSGCWEAFLRVGCCEGTCEIPEVAFGHGGAKERDDLDLPKRFLRGGAAAEGLDAGGAVVLACEAMRALTKLGEFSASRDQALFLSARLHTRWKVSPVPCPPASLLRVSVRREGSGREKAL